MNHWMFQQNAFLACEEMTMEAVACPKPRRLSLLATNMSVSPTKPLRWQLSNPDDIYDSQIGADILDIILTKDGGYVSELAGTQTASSPPFFCGSPPSRASNPLIKDDRFGDEKILPFSPLSPIAAPTSGSSISPSSSSRTGSCTRSSFGNKPVVRVEGFDCLSRDGRRHGIPTLA
ncbi:hypothetical protein SAY87_015986 [Trapa incisa]|uniref:Uncharacterized protein n=2 Tax=Trapa TaxID=22665 RepID=A0AAN7LHM3_TRANT|nr:hypothetical protein SAY87_015986 [Trapa incisa]KAK4785625.1 hypothetical protein SAY86_002314 [Trapa natans]